MKTIVAGIGSPHGDDQLGWHVADELAGLIGQSLVVYKTALPIEILNLVDATDELIICDACRTDRPIGSVWSWNWPSKEIEICRFSGSHDISLPAALALAEQLGQLPRRVTIWAVNIGAAEPAGELTPKVAAAVSEVSRQIAESINHA